MNENTKPPILTEENQYKDKPKIDKKPDEQSGLNIEAKIKIFDPESNEVFVEGRA